MTAHELLNTVLGSTPELSPEQTLARTELTAGCLPQGAFSALADALGVSKKKLALTLFVPYPSVRKTHLTPEATGAVYALVCALGQLQAVMGWPPRDGLTWLRLPCLQLKGRVPAALLCSSIGSEYVGVAISRLRTS